MRCCKQRAVACAFPARCLPPEKLEVHVPHLIQQRGDLRWCSVCGLYGDRVIRGLRLSCTKQATKDGRRCLAAIQRGVHPGSGAKLAVLAGGGGCGGGGGDQRSGVRGGLVLPADEASLAETPSAVRSCQPEVSLTGEAARSSSAFDDYCVLLDAASDEPAERQLASQLFAASRGRVGIGGSGEAAAGRGVVARPSRTLADYCALLDAASGEPADRRLASQLFAASRSRGGVGGVGEAAAGVGEAAAGPGEVGGGAGEPWRGEKRARDAHEVGGEGLDGAQHAVRRRLTRKQAATGIEPGLGASCER